MASHHDRSVDFSCESVERAEECADLLAYDFIAAVEVDGDVEDGEPGMEVEGRFAELMEEFRKRWFSQAIENDQFVLVFFGSRKQVHVSCPDAVAAIGGVNRRLPFFCVVILILSVSANRGAFHDAQPEPGKPCRAT